MSNFQHVVFQFCLLLIPYTQHSQQIPRSEADSLLRILAQSKPDTNRIKVLIRLGEFQVYKAGSFKADLDSARTYGNQARAFSHKLGNYPMEAKSFNLLGFINLELRDFHLAIAFQQAVTNLFYQP